jgi:chromosome partitioning protein
MRDEYVDLQKIAQIFCPIGNDHIQFKNKILELEEQGLIPKAQRLRRGALFKKSWKSEDLPLIGKYCGFLPEKKSSRGRSISVFTTKGGVLKTTLALNIARTAALHGQKVCVVGLDIQGDITNALGFQSELEDAHRLDDVLEQVQRTQGLMDVFRSKARLEDVIVPIGANLALIPETAELAQLNDALNTVNRREYWLREKIVERLKDIFDLVVMDCSPNWNKLTTNALVASDLLVSPLECKINNFRNFKVFGQFLEQFVQEMRMELKTMFVPTRYTKTRKLSIDILQWYQKNVPDCSTYGIRDCVLGEEAVALNSSFLEHKPGHAASQDMKSLLSEIFSRLDIQTDDDFVPRFKQGSDALQL